MLSGLIEKKNSVKSKYEQSKKSDDKKKPGQMEKEVTALCMPPALIEGFESMCLFGAIILLPQY